MFLLIVIGSSCLSFAALVFFILITFNFLSLSRIHKGYAMGMSAAVALFESVWLLRALWTSESAELECLYGLTFVAGYLTHFMFETYILEVFCQSRRWLSTKIFKYIRIAGFIVCLIGEAPNVYIPYLGEHYPDSPFWYKTFTIICKIQLSLFIFGYQISHNVAILYCIKDFIRSTSTEYETLVDKETKERGSRHLYRLTVFLICLDLTSAIFYALSLVYKTNPVLYMNFQFVSTALPCVLVLFSIVFYLIMVKIQFGSGKNRQNPSKKKVKLSALSNSIYVTDTAVNPSLTQTRTSQLT